MKLQIFYIEMLFKTLWILIFILKFTIQKNQDKDVFVATREWQVVKKGTVK